MRPRSHRSLVQRLSVYHMVFRSNQRSHNFLAIHITRAYGHLCIRTRAASQPPRKPECATCACMHTDSLWHAFDAATRCQRYIEIDTMPWCRCTKHCAARASRSVSERLTLNFPTQKKLLGTLRCVIDTPLYVVPIALRAATALPHTGRPCTGLPISVRLHVSGRVSKF